MILAMAFGIWYDGYYAADASDYEEAEMEYWNTH